MMIPPQLNTKSLLKIHQKCEDWLFEEIKKLHTHFFNDPCIVVIHFQSTHTEIFTWNDMMHHSKMGEDADS